MVAWAAACLLLAAPPTGGAVSVGRANHGRLQGAATMPLTGAHHRFTSVARKRQTNYGTPALVALLERAAAVVDQYVDTPPLILGSLSKQHGGRFGPHKSHQSGRDVDILFYMRGPKGARKAARGFYTFDGAGRCAEAACAGYTFDVQANWWLVRTLLWSKRPQVQYIFVSAGLKRLMLAYAKRRQEHPDILRRARHVLVQPRNSSPHADHFHVRVYCSAQDHARGCEDFGPRWRWVTANR